MTTSEPESGASQPEHQRPMGTPYDPYAGYPQYPHDPRYAYPQQPPPSGWAGYQWTAPIGAYGPPQQPPPHRGSGGRRALLGVGAAVLAAALVVSGIEIGQATRSDTTAGRQADGSSLFGSGSGSGSGSTGTGGENGNGNTGGGTLQIPDPFPGLFPGQQGQGSQTQGTGTAASSTQQRGIVTITSVLKYQNAESAGTGMILTSGGEVLTNNHVIDGATSVTVTDESTGKSYAAKVVGTDPTDDVAVLQLKNASGLTTAKVGDTSDVKQLGVGDKVTGVGNAGGTGSLTQVSGKVTALQRSITASDETGGNAENLSGLIQTDAAIVAGDSGGPLYDANGTVVGIDTAASSTNGTQGVTSQGYAIPIDHALSIARQIESGIETSSVHIGLPAFLGVGVANSTTSGAAVSTLLDGGPAAAAGITPGSVITAVGGTSVTNAAGLKTALGKHQPGDRVSLHWTDTAGKQHTATVTLAGGPAD